MRKRSTAELRRGAAASPAGEQSRWWLRRSRGRPAAADARTNRVVQRQSSTQLSRRPVRTAVRRQRLGEQLADGGQRGGDNAGSGGGAMVVRQRRRQQRWCDGGVATTRWRDCRPIGGVISTSSMTRWIQMVLTAMLYFNICCEDVALAYIDGRRQIVCSLLGGLGGAQPVAEEPSLSRRSPALQSKMGVWPWASMALGGAPAWRNASPPARAAIAVVVEAKSRTTTCCRRADESGGATKQSSVNGSGGGRDGGAARGASAGAIGDVWLRRDGALSTDRRRDFDEFDDAMDSNGFDGHAIVEIVVDRVGPLASESWLLFICDMSSYPDAVDISQLSVRWGL
ncbi:hypothetical protein Scep_001522 [Stephania cephalantha]|uniref:Uncharacterized protein n=1 Tax=Stephania cephalantha TaxID=152367 RepID=A0AAP0Q7U2_9MAGN